MHWSPASMKRTIAILDAVKNASLSTCSKVLWQPGFSTKPNRVKRLRLGPVRFNLRYLIRYL